MTGSFVDRLMHAPLLCKPRLEELEPERHLPATTTDLIAQALPRLRGLQATLVLLSLLGSDTLLEMRRCSRGWRALAATLQRELRRSRWRVFAVGAVPSRGLAFRECAPAPIEVPLPRSPLTRHSSGGAICGHSVFVMEDGVWAFGFNAAGQLMTGDFNLRHVEEPVRALPAGGVADVVAGVGCTVVQGANGGLQAWGTLRPQLMSPVLPPQLQLPAAKRRVASVGAGAAFTAALLEDGSVWTWGTDSKGALGHDAEDGSARRVPGLPPARRLAVGVHHVLAVARDGHRLFTWGGRSYRSAPRRRADALERFVWRHVRGGVPAPWLAGGCAVSGCRRAVLACGLCQRCLINDLVQRGGFAGLSAGGEDSPPPKSCVRAPEEVDELAGLELADVAAGEEHSVALGVGGGVFAWGGGPDDRLDPLGTPTPQFHDAELRVVSISAAASYWVAVTVPR